MRLGRRIRRGLKWGGLAASVVLVCVWAASGWWYADWFVSRRLEVIVVRGVVWVYRPVWKYRGQVYPRTPRLVVGRIIDTDPPRWEHAWLPHTGSGDWGTQTRIPLWLVVLPVALATAGAWRLDSLAWQRRGARCPACDYDLAGLPARTGVCPECGARLGVADGAPGGGAR